MTCPAPKPLSPATPATGEPRAFYIAVAERPAGLALRQGRGFSFVAADPDFLLLEGSRFARLEQVEAAARRLAESLARRPTRLPRAA